MSDWSSDVCSSDLPKAPVTNKPMIATAIAVAYAFPNSRKPAHALARQLGAPPHAFSSSVTVTPYCFVWLSLEQKMAHQQGRAMAARFPADQELQQASLQLVAELWDALDFRRSVTEVQIGRAHV